MSVYERTCRHQNSCVPIRVDGLTKLGLPGTPPQFSGWAGTRVGDANWIFVFPSAVAAKHTNTAGFSHSFIPKVACLVLECIWCVC